MSEETFMMYCCKRWGCRKASSRAAHQGLAGWRRERGKVCPEGCRVSRGSQVPRRGGGLKRGSTMFWAKGAYARGSRHSVSCGKFGRVCLCLSCIIIDSIPFYSQK